MYFKGTRSETVSYLRTLSNKFYVYVLCRPDGRPFYVGKGSQNRILHHEAEARRHHPFGESNPIKCNVIRKIIGRKEDIIYKIDSCYELHDEITCLKREAELIKTYRRLHEGGCLTNLASGLGNISGASPFSIEKHAKTLSGEPINNPDRAKLNRFLLSLGSVKSVPIKPLNQITRILPTTPHPQSRKPTLRSAYALLASTIACGLKFPDKQIIIPRTFEYDGVKAIVENGVARDILKSDMSSLASHAKPTKEKFVLNTNQQSNFINLVGEQLLVNHGVL